MNFVNSGSGAMGSAVFAARRAADLTFVLQNNDQLDARVVLQKVQQTLANYDEPTPKVTIADLVPMQGISAQLYAIFAAKNTDAAAKLLNAMLARHASAPRLTGHAGTPWHIHVDGDDHAPWAEWFAASSALAIAMLLAEKQRNPGGICASRPCGRPFIDSGKGGGRLYCSPRCATRERVATHRKLQAD